MNLEPLEELGLSPGMITVYEAVLQIGIAPIHKIQERTSIERRNIYDILNKLIERGLVTYTEENGTRTYQTTHPSTIQRLIDERMSQLAELQAELPAMTELFASTRPEIRAEVLRGNEAMKSLLDEALEHPASYWIGGNSGVERTPIKHWFSHWMDRRVEQQKWLYDLADHGTYLKGLDDVTVDNKQFYSRRSLPKDLSSPMVVLIFGDKVAQILWSKRSFAFVLQSEQIRDSFMRYFEYFWNGQDGNEPSLRP